MGEERVKNRYASGKGMENNMQENKLLLDFFSILLHNSKSIRGRWLTGCFPAGRYVFGAVFWKVCKNTRDEFRQCAVCMGTKGM